MMEAGWLPERVHALADVFPMLPEDELAALAEDIKENGLLTPIVIDADGVLIDGRNRLAACQLAGVQPTFQKLNGHDAASYIVSANLNRRNLNKGQQAMALAMIYPDGEKGGRGKKSDAVNSAESAGFSMRRLQDARTILRHSRALAEEVRDGHMPFDLALKEVASATQTSRSTETQLADLRRRAPDVAALVDDERIVLESGLIELRARQARLAETIEAARRAIRVMMQVPVQMTIIKTAMTLTDADLALLDLLRKDADPFADIEREDRKAVAAAAGAFATLKFRPSTQED